MSGKLHSVAKLPIGDRVATLEAARAEDSDRLKKIDERLERMDGMLEGLVKVWATAGRIKRVIDWIFRAAGYCATVGGAVIAVWTFFFHH